MGRGIDIDKVNYVINFDMPDSKETYLHRVNLLLYINIYSRLEEQEDKKQMVLQYHLLEQMMILQILEIEQLLLMKRYYSPF